MATMETVNPKVLGEVAAAALGSGAKRATKYLSEKLTVKATLQGKPLHRDRQRTIVLTVGAPNYDERVYIKRCKAAGEPFPIKKIQLKMLKEAANNL